jgi:hypothetical protein
MRICRARREPRDGANVCDTRDRRALETSNRGQTAQIGISLWYALTRLTGQEKAGECRPASWKRQEGSCFATT